jgi:serine/threonine protein kinase
MSSPSQFPAEFESDGARYELGRMLGRGNAGAVYLALDRETGEQVALKKLFRIDTKSVLRLKREFRALTNIHHANLVKLYDLGRTGDSWFLTMEYIEGPDLLHYLAPEAAAETKPEAERAGMRMNQPAHEVPYGRLVGAFLQLANGVHALHRAGMLHRDLKPSNVLVANGRVVALDFGLVRELDEEDALVTHDGTISGTPAYMPPEQALGHKLSEVSDWYAFGVMLYQALAGRLPIEGRNANELLRRKLEREAPALEGIQPPIPARLNRLCMRLLQRDPKDRPSGDEVLEVLSWVEPDTVNQDFPVQHSEVTLQTEARIRPVASSLFGRDRELAELQDALAQARRGEPVVVHVRGTSGAGKSSLLESFLEHAERERGSVRHTSASSPSSPATTRSCSPGAATSARPCPSRLSTA